MSLCRDCFLALVIFVATTVPTTHALTLGEFKLICARASVHCHDHPILQAYIGGALDMITVLDERTDDLSEVYCVDTVKLFDVSSIIAALESAMNVNDTDNAMVFVVHYLRDQGGC